jgi:uncharacterized protein
MTLFFPDLNVWLALSVADHSHSADSWSWIKHLPPDAKLLFSRYTQIGLLRLLTNRSVMGQQVLILRKAWRVYDAWLEDPRVEFYPEPRSVDTSFRHFTEPFAAQPASKSVGDCWLLACAKEIGATLATFDKTLNEFSRKQGCPSIIPG